MSEVFDPLATRDSRLATIIEGGFSNVINPGNIGFSNKKSEVN